ncbi:MAG: peptide deformylase [Mycoplasmataceae bacterium]|nr:peptide deformylase [Mycoplasmataceae bacterium]
MAKEINKINTKKLKRIEPKDIIQDDNPIIRKISFDIPFPLSKEDKTTMNQMVDYVRSSQDKDETKKRSLRSAYGISAVQIGKPKKMLFVRIENKFGGEAEEFALVNPKIIKSSTKKSFLDSGEGCLSVPREYDGYVLRSSSVIINAIDYFSEREVEIEANGLTSIVLQHEMDHLMGILFYDRINKLNPWAMNDKTAIKIK